MQILLQGTFTGLFFLEGAQTPSYPWMGEIVKVCVFAPRAHWMVVLNPQLSTDLRL